MQITFLCAPFESLVVLSGVARITIASSFPSFETCFFFPLKGLFWRCCGIKPTAYCSARAIVLLLHYLLPKISVLICAISSCFLPVWFPHSTNAAPFLGVNKISALYKTKSSSFIPGLITPFMQCCDVYYLTINTEITLLLERVTAASSPSWHLCLLPFVSKVYRAHNAFYCSITIHTECVLSIKPVVFFLAVPLSFHSLLTSCSARSV